MKSFVLSFILLSAVTASAGLKATATLDLQSTYGNFNAGLFEVTSVITETSQIEVGSLSQSTFRDDGEYFCVTTLTVPVGTITTTLKNVLTGETLTQSKDLQAVTSIRDASETCTVTAASFKGEQKLYVTTSSQPFFMQMAPAGYSHTLLWVNPLQTLTVKAFVDKDDSTLSLNTTGLFHPASLFAAGSFNEAAVNFYLQAINGDSALSLAVGTLPMTVK